MKALLLCAGKGTRLRPFTFTRPKHLLPIVGKPLIKHIIDGLKAAGIKDIIILIGYLDKLIKEYLGDGSEFGVNIEFVNQDDPKGTAQAVGLAEEIIGSEPFFMQYGDVLISADVYISIIKKFEKKKPHSILSVYSVEDPSKYGVIAKENDKVKKIIEKPDPGSAPTNLANAGVYIFSHDIFNAIKRTKLSKRNEYEITDSIQMLIDDDFEIIDFEINSIWKDIGVPWDLLEANELLLPNWPLENRGIIENNVTIKDPVGIGEGTVIRSGSYIDGPVLIGKNCDIGPNCYLRSNTVLGDKVRVGNACEIKASLVMSNSKIPHLSYIGDSIIGRNVNLGAGTITANLKFTKGSVKAYIKDKRVDSRRKKLGAIIGDNSQSGIGVTFMPGVIIGVNCVIGPNMNIWEDIPNDTLILPKEETIKKDWTFKN
ncbi:MAG: NTP transferase domain-containing protein [Candidatus Helarchaeota archaeon]|nr:NTP transferase domain-containing protein [Candidatus Helarchaeota archaeon]